MQALVCWLDLWHKLPPPFVSQFHSDYASSQYVTAYFPVTAPPLSLESGLYIAVFICLGYNWAALFLGSLRWDSKVWLWVLSDSDHWVITLQSAGPSSRQRGRPKEARPQISDSNIPTGSWSQVPQGCSTPRHTHWLTVSRKVTSTSTMRFQWLRLAPLFHPKFENGSRYSLRNVFSSNLKVKMMDKVNKSSVKKNYIQHVTM
jgi:hypothetical protein